MHNDDNIRAAIESSRKTSDDGSLVVYNLTKGVDFSNPKVVAEVLARVLFEKDAYKWFSVKGDHVEFRPAFKVKVLLADEHSNLLHKTVNNFLEDLKKDEIDKEFAHQIHEIRAEEEGQRTAAGLAAIGMVLNKPFFMKEDKTEIEDLFFTQILEVLEIRTPDDEDLIDWEKLPI